MRQKKADLVVSTVYLHVGNSGLTVSVVDAGHGPEFVVESSSFGNLRSSHRTATTVSGLVSIRDMLNHAIERGGYSKEYCYPATPPGEDGGSCGTGPGIDGDGGDSPGDDAGPDTVTITSGGISRTYDLSGVGKRTRVSGESPADDLACDWCAQVKRTAIHEIWSEVDPAGHLRRLCADCCAGCAGG